MTPPTLKAASPVGAATAQAGWGDDEETDTSKRKESIELVDTVPEEVGLEGRGFVWRPLQDQDEDSDDIRVEKWPFSEGSSLPPSPPYATTLYRDHWS